MGTGSEQWAYEEEPVTDKHGSRRAGFRVVGEQDEARTVADMVPDAPREAADLLVPDGYELSMTSTSTLKTYTRGNTTQQVPEHIAPAPMVVTGRLRDIESGDESLRLAWRRDGWQSRVESRAVVMNARELVQMAGKGFPVNSGSAGAISRYLEAFEKANLERLSVERVTAHLGWQGARGEYGFLWGRTQLARPGTDTVTFRGASVGDEQMMRGFHSEGSIDEWLDGIAPMADYPKVLLAFYAAFVPPLLDILDCPNFIVDWSSRTSTGKTTLLRIAASVAGQPDEDAAGSIIGSWDTTRVAAERRCALLSGLPVVLDDTRKAKKAEALGEMVYTIVSGQGRGRGNLAGLDRVQTWRTVALSTGEAALTSFTTAGGVRGRVLSVTGYPFGSTDASELVRDLNRAVTAHYGHALPLFVESILERREQWERWRQAYQRERDRLARMARNSVGDRLAAYFAAITTTARLVHLAFEAAGYPLPWKYTRQLDAVWASIAQESDEAPVDARALQDVLSWAQANEGKFLDRASVGSSSLYGPREPSGGWLGLWPAGEQEYIAFFPPKLKQELEGLGYRPQEVIDGWREQGWLVLDGEGKLKQVRCCGTKSRMVVLTQQAVETVTGPQEDNGDEEIDSDE